VSDPGEAIAKPKRTIYGPWINGFLKSLQPAGAFAEALRGAGYDSDHPASKYSVSAFLNLLDVSRCYLFPSLPPPEGQWNVGRLLISGYVEGGLSGKLWARAFPIVGPELMIKAAGKYSSAGTNFLVAEAVKLGDKQWRILFRDTGGTPAHLIAGMAEYALDLAGAPSGRKVAVTRDEREQFALDLRW
jgi:uncharacterized protein (TIGR02265 family)